MSLASFSFGARRAFRSFGNWTACRYNSQSAALERVPPYEGKIRTPEAFLKAIGRSAETKVSVESWADLFKLRGDVLRQAGVGVRDRRYILWCMEKFRQKVPIPEFAHEGSSKKTIRGWGPKVQGGKRIRSKRIKDKTKQQK